MVPIKIQCACGQKYAFDVEPVDGCVPYAVACPVCGADGTEAANTIIAQQSAATSASSSGRGLRLQAAGAPATAAPAAGPVPVARLVSAAPAIAVVARPASPVPAIPGMTTDRTQAEHEARAKIFWGDSSQDVIKYLMMQGFRHDEAATLVAGLSQERSATVRRKGIRKILTGIPVMCTPVVGFFLFISSIFFPVQLFAITILIGLWGGWMTLKGILMLTAPGLDHGDLTQE